MAFDIEPSRTIPSPRDWSRRFAIVEALEQSGESLSSFSRSRGIALSTLHSWRRKYRSTAAPVSPHSLPSFVEVKSASELASELLDTSAPISLPPPSSPPPIGSSPASQLSLEFGDGFILRFSPGDSPSAVASFVRGFREAY